jgi:purine nucleosidase
MIEKILLDTDIGTDIDDAVCLAYLLATPNCDLLGITTVTGEAIERAKLASVLCKIAGKNIPIYPGSENPLIIPQKQIKAQQAIALERWEHDTEFPKGEAIEFLRKTIRNYPGEVTLLTIGPLTNVGLLFSIDPEIPSLLKSLVMMCGYYERKNNEAYPLEWNAFGDYHASHLVFNANVEKHFLVGLDVTTRVTMNSREFKEIFDHDLLKPVIDFSDAWFEMYPMVTFHDPLAAVCIFNDEVCEFQKGNVEIELQEKDLCGLTKWNIDKDGKHHVALEVNKDLFFEEYFSVFK